MAVFGLRLMSMFGAAALSATAFAGTELRELSGFSEVHLAVPAELLLVQGAKEYVEVTARDDVLPRIRTVVRGDRLLLELEDGGRWWRDGNPGVITITVAFQAIDELSVAGSGDARADELKAPVLDLSVAGSGSIEIDVVEAKTLELAGSGSGHFELPDVTVETLDASIAGSGRARLTGRAAVQDISIAGSGRLLADELQGERVSVSVLGSGQAELWAEERLDVSVLGSGRVSYRGNAEVSQSISGSGSVRQR